MVIVQFAMLNYQRVDNVDTCRYNISNVPMVYKPTVASPAGTTWWNWNFCWVDDDSQTGQKIPCLISGDEHPHKGHFESCWSILMFWLFTRFHHIPSKWIKMIQNGSKWFLGVVRHFRRCSFSVSMFGCVEVDAANRTPTMPLIYTVTSTHLARLGGQQIPYVYIYIYVYTYICNLWQTTKIYKNWHLVELKREFSSNWLWDFWPAGFLRRGGSGGSGGSKSWLVVWNMTFIFP